MFCTGLFRYRFCPEQAASRKATGEVESRPPRTLKTLARSERSACWPRARHNAAWPERLSTERQTCIFVRNPTRFDACVFDRRMRQLAGERWERSAGSLRRQCGWGGEHPCIHLYPSSVVHAAHNWLPKPAKVRASNRRVAALRYLRLGSMLTSPCAAPSTGDEEDVHTQDKIRTKPGSRLVPRGAENPRPRL